MTPGIILNVCSKNWLKSTKVKNFYPEGSPIRRRQLRLWVVGVFGALALTVCLHDPASAEPAWLAGDYPYILIERRLEDVLMDLGTNVGVPVRISDQVKSWVNGPVPLGSGRKFLDRLAHEHGFEWYFDGDMLDISAVSEMEERVIDTSGIQVSKIKQSLTSLGIANSRFKLRLNRKEDLAIVIGPPRYVALVENIIGSMRGKSIHTVEVIRGRAL